MADLEQKATMSATQPYVIFHTHQTKFCQIVNTSTWMGVDCILSSAHLHFTWKHRQGLGNKLQKTNADHEWPRAIKRMVVQNRTTVGQRNYWCKSVALPVMTAYSLVWQSLRCLTSSFPPSSPEELRLSSWLCFCMSSRITWINIIFGSEKLIDTDRLSQLFWQQQSLISGKVVSSALRHKFSKTSKTNEERACGRWRTGRVVVQVLHDSARSGKSVKSSSQRRWKNKGSVLHSAAVVHHSVCCSSWLLDYKTYSQDRTSPSCYIFVTFGSSFVWLIIEFTLMIFTDQAMLFTDHIHERDDEWI